MAAKVRRTSEEKFWIAVLWGASVAVFFFLVAPILAIVPLSFNSREFLTYPLSGFSLRWCQQFFSSAEWMRAFENSFIIGSASTLLATALGLTQADFRGKGLVMAIRLSSMIVPVLIVAVGFYFFFAPLGLTGIYLGLVLAHTALGAPLVVVTVMAALRALMRA